MIASVSCNPSEHPFRTLILSKSYEPIKVVHWHKAICLLMTNKIEVVEEYDSFVRSVNSSLRIPSVARLLSQFRRNRNKIKFSRANIFARDRYKCQYCGKKGLVSELTHDHVVPRAHGGKTEWTNIVTACYSCNYKKKDRTPDKAGMKLRSVPIHPNWVPSININIDSKEAPSAWASYLYWNSDISE